MYILWHYDERTSIPFPIIFPNDSLQQIALQNPAAAETVEPSPPFPPPVASISLQVHLPGLSRQGRWHGIEGWWWLFPMVTKNGSPVWTFEPTTFTIVMFKCVFRVVKTWTQFYLVKTCWVLTGQSILVWTQIWSNCNISPTLISRK